jgi:hypothetical protein
MRHTRNEDKSSAGGEVQLRSARSLILLCIRKISKDVVHHCQALLTSAAAAVCALANIFRVGTNPHHPCILWISVKKGCTVRNGLRNPGDYPPLSRREPGITV